MNDSLQRIWAIVIRHLFTWPRELESLAEAFWWPSFDIFIWGLMTVFIQRSQRVANVFISFFLGAIIFWMFVYRAQQEMSFSFLREVWDRNLLNILTTPLSIWEFLGATFILGIFKMLISAAWMVFLAYILFSFDIFKFGFYLIPFIINLLIVGWSAGFVINGFIVRYGFRVQAFAWTMILIIQPFSAVFYPVSSMPSVMQAIAKFLPTSYIFEGMRSVLLNGFMDLKSLLMASGLNLIYLIFSLLVFKTIFYKTQKAGSIIKFS